MSEANKKKLKPGTTVVLRDVPPGFLNDLPTDDQEAISEVIGKAVTFNEYDEEGRAELEFKDSNGAIHFIYVRPEFIGLPD
jgi:hypothetical protein